MTAALLIITSFTIFIIQRNNGLQDNMHRYDVDEEHTVYAAISSKGNYRVGEGIRLLISTSLSLIKATGNSANIINKSRFKPKPFG